MTDTPDRPTPLVVFHASCADGFTAAWVAWRRLRELGAEPELLAARYGDAPPDVGGRDVFVLDFSYPRETLLEMQATARSLVVLDHHKSAAAALEGLPFCTFDMQRSGAGLAWDHFYPGQPRPWLVDYVEDRDLWRWALPDSRAVTAWTRTIDFDLERWSELAAEPLAPIVERGRAILAYVDRLVGSHVRHAAPARLAGYVVPIVNATAEVSEIGNELAREAPFAAMWSAHSDGRFAYSLRSCPEYAEAVDVSVIAGLFGGGGHRHAAGFVVPELVHERAESEEASR